ALHPSRVAQRRADQPLVVPDSVRDIGRLQKRGAETRIPGLTLGFTALDQEVAALGLASLMSSVQQFERTLVPALSFVRSELLESLIACQNGVPKRGLELGVDRLRPVAGEFSRSPL